MMNLSAIVLACGGSGRFGRDKLSMGFNGAPMLAGLLKKLSGGGFGEKILVTNDDVWRPYAERFGFQIVGNPFCNRGQSESVKAGVLSACSENGLMFFAADQPLLALKSVKALIRAYAQDPSRVTMPVWDETPGNPVIFPPGFRPALLSLEGDKGGRALITPDTPVNHIFFPDASEGMDVDTPYDFREALMRGSSVVVVRGGGDIATGVVQALKRGGFWPVVLERAAPTSIRRLVCLSEAVFDGVMQVEDLTGRLVQNIADIPSCFEQDIVPVLIDPHGDTISEIGPFCLVDAMLAKQNLGTTRAMAPLTIGLGPGFTAGGDVDAVIETMRGHDLGRMIRFGRAQENTGIPGEIGGQSVLRVVRCPANGVLQNPLPIGTVVQAGQIIADVSGVPVPAAIGGILRGMLRPGLAVHPGMKIADIDPRLFEAANIGAISDKARAIGGAVLQCVLMEKFGQRQRVCAP